MSAMGRMGRRTLSVGKITRARADYARRGATLSEAVGTILIGQPRISTANANSC
jgi:hypothetical protein